MDRTFLDIGTNFYVSHDDYFYIIYIGKNLNICASEHTKQQNLKQSKHNIKCPDETHKNARRIMQHSPGILLLVSFSRGALS